MGSEAVLVEKQEALAVITLNRPDSFNALNLELAEGLIVALRGCFDENIRAVVIKGNGKAFCAGGDLSYMQSERTFAEALDKLTFLVHRAITDIRLLPKPVIAIVNGVAAGAGMSLALACDLRLASEKAKFKQAYTSSGLVPDGGWSVWVPAMLGLGRASELVFLDDVLDARQALELGLLNRVIPESELEEETAQIAKKMAGGATKAYAKAKENLNQSILPHLETLLEKERQGMINISHTEDAKEGLEAFLGKRTPRFKGR